MKLIIVRHGESEANAKGIHQGQRVNVGLSGRGKEQARRVAERLNNENIEAIYSSDLKRACETAEEIARAHNLKVIQDKRLREFDIGDFTDKEKLWVLFHSHKVAESSRLGIPKWEVKAPGGESELDHIHRVEGFFNEIIKKHKGSVLIVAHGGTNKIFFSVAGYASREQMYNIPQANSAVNIIDISNKENKVYAINDLSHLSKDDKVIDLFESVRNIPLRMPESLKEDDCRCWGKHRALKRALEEAGYKSKFVVCFFKWSEQNLPEEIIKIKHADEDYHLFLKVKVHGDYFVVDASNDSKLPEYNSWDSLHDCILAVKPIKIFNFEESKVLEKKETEEFPERFKENKKFYKALNKFFGKIRK